MHIVLVGSLLLSLSEIQPLAQVEERDEHQDLYSAWLQHHPRSYDPSEQELRSEYFVRSVRELARLQKRSPRATYDIMADETADWSDAERRARGSGGVASFDDLPEHVAFSTNATALPADIDWVTRGAVNRPESQGRCGTCMDFSGTASVESAWFLAGHKLERLSVQQVVDCCGGGKGGPGYCMDWVRSTGGLALESDYPLANHSDPTLKGCRSPCNTTAGAHRVATIASVACLHGHAEDQIRAMLDDGPVSVSISAHFLNGYKHGIINCTADGIDHAVQLVGYGHENGFAYWKLRNSWGADFGEGGYFRFVYGQTCLRGACQAHAPSR